MLSNYPALRPSLLLDFANAAAVDPRVTFTRHSRATAFDARGQLRTFDANAPRIDYDPATLACRGLLIEEQRTNSIRNNTMQGAVAGTPGTLPTNWQITGSGLGTLTQQIVGTGTANGITYIDIKLSGTTSTTGLAYSFEPTVGGPAASSGQTWTGSNYVAVVGGSITNINAIRGAQLTGRTAGGAGTTDGFDSGDNKASLTATLQRFSVTGTLAAATTVALQPSVSLSFSSGVAIDITLRIGLPQLEQGAFATSVIPTTTAAVTRSADTASMTGANFSSWYNATEGTLYAESQRIAAPTVAGFPRIVSFNDGTINNENPILWSQSGQKLFSAAFAGGVLQTDLGYFGQAQTALQKTATAYRTNDFAFTANAQAVQTDTAGTIPTANQLQIGGAPGAPGGLGGWIRRIAYYPRRLTDAELLAITA